MGVPFQCCTQLHAIDPSVSICRTSHPPDRRRRLRRLVSAPACCAPPPPDTIPTSSTSDLCHFHALPEDLLLDCLARLPRSSLHSASMVCRRWKEAVLSDGFVERRRKLGTLEPLLLKFGGAACATFSEREGRWSTKAMAMSAEVGMELEQAQAAAVVAEANEYVAAEDKWRRLQAMPRARYACLGAAVGGVFYVIGGLKAASSGGGGGGGGMQTYYTYLSSMEAYDADAEAWQKTRALPTGGCIIACTAVEASIYMLSSHAVELSLWRYETRTERWSRMKAPPIPTPLRLDNRLRFCCAAVGGVVYVVQVGGNIDDLLRRSGRATRGLKDRLVLMFETKAQRWARAADLPSLLAEEKNNGGGGGAAAAVVLVNC